jgi:polyhydroxybutyrate depolymerase
MNRSIFIALTTMLLFSVLTACAQANPATPEIPTATVPEATPTEPAPAAASESMNLQRQLTVNGLERSYILHLPAAPTSNLLPLVFIFHGYGETAPYIQQVSGMDAIADANSFVVVYPSGSGAGNSQSWNGGTCCGYALDNAIDETAFVRQIIEDVGTLVKIDPTHVYASGFSNGALLSYKLACQMADTFAAVAPVGGVLTYEDCQPKNPVAVIHFHGLNDPTVPFDGHGNIPSPDQPFPSVGESIAAWVNINGCDDTPQTEEASVYTHTIYSSCQDNSAVELYAVKGIGHSWPSQYIVPASQIIWDFFMAHPHQ